MANNVQGFIMQVQVPIIAGDIVEAQKKAKDMLDHPETMPYTFFQIVPAQPAEVKKG